jgi:hypothetical protein
LKQYTFRLKYCHVINFFLKAIGDSELVKTYESLKKLQSEIAVWEDELTHKNSTLGSLQKTELKNRN